MVIIAASFIIAFGAIVLVVQYLLTVFHEYAAARLHGCGSVTRYPHTLPWGVDLFRARREAVKEGRYNKLFLAHFQQLGSTWEEQTWRGGIIINTSDTANFQAILSTNFDDFGKDQTRSRSSGAAFLGRGIFSEHGAKWRVLRNLIKPLFARAELNDIDRFAKHADDMLALIPRDGTTVDMQPLLQSLDETGKTAEFTRRFNLAMAGASKRLNTAFGRLDFLFIFDKAWKENVDYVHKVIDELIAEGLAKRDDGSCDELPKKRKPYVLLYELADHFKDPIVLRHQLLNVFFPARDSVGIALSNTLFFLARSPEIWVELRRQAAALGNTKLDFETIKSMHFFRYCLFEGMRLQGPSGRLARMALKDTILPRGGGPDKSLPVFVPKGTNVAMNSFVKYYDPKVWGSDIDVFRPSRFEGRLFTWEHIPFNGGPRICPASQQVISQGTYLLVRLAQLFESIENRDPCYEYVEHIRGLCCSRNGVKIAFHAPSEEVKVR